MTTTESVPYHYWLTIWVIDKCNSDRIRQEKLPSNRGFEVEKTWITSNDMTMIIIGSVYKYK